MLTKFYIISDHITPFNSRGYHEKQQISYLSSKHLTAFSTQYIDQYSSFLFQKKKTQYKWK